MLAGAIALTLVGAAALAVSTQSFLAFQGPPSIARQGGTQMSSNRISSTVAASYVAREGLHVDPAVPLTPDAMYVVMKREPELVEFLQCDLFRASPLFQIVRPDYLKAWMAVHPCGG